MKKLTLFLALMMNIVLIGCTFDFSTSSVETTSPVTTLLSSVTNPYGILEFSQADVEEAMEEEVVIHLSSALSPTMAGILSNYAYQFQSIYPNVQIQFQSHDQSIDLLNHYIDFQLEDDADDLVVAENSYIDYLSQQDYLENLLPFIYSDALIIVDDPLASDSFDPRVGLDLEGYNPSFIQIEGTDSNANLKVFPFLLDSTVLVLNRTILKSRGSEIQGLGYLISEEGFLPADRVLTFEEMRKISSLFGDLPFLVLDHFDNSFFDALSQFDSNIVDGDGMYNFDLEKISAWIRYIRELRDLNVLSIPDFEGDSTALSLFSSQNAIMVQVNSSSLSDFTYGISSYLDDDEFEIDILPGVQLIHENSPTISIGGIEYQGDLIENSIFNAFSFGINRYSSNAEKLYSWLFIRYVTDPSNNLDLALRTNTMSIVDLEENPGITTYRFTGDYQSFLELGQNYIDSDAAPEWSEIDPYWMIVYSSLVQYALYVNSQYGIPYPEVLYSIPEDIDLDRIMFNEMYQSIFESEIDSETIIQTLLSAIERQ